MAALEARRAPRLIIGVGNPSRGDDALGPMFLERIGALLEPEIERGEVELLCEFQLQVEHALDLERRSLVLFVDASVSLSAPFELVRVEPAQGTSFSTHALAPSALLHAFQNLYGDPPESWLLAIAGARFELGEPLSFAAAANLEAALARAAPWLRAPS